MKKITELLSAILLGAALAVVPSACSDDYDDVAPGSYVDTERIATFPGDNVLVPARFPTAAPSPW